MSEANKKTIVEKLSRLFGKRSISRNLTGVLAILVLVVVASILSLAYLKVSHDMHRELERKADEHIYYLSKSLSIPIWSFDSEGIELVGSVFSKTDFLKRLVIVDINGKVLFHYEIGSDDKKRTSRDQWIEYNQKIIGRVFISLGYEFIEDSLLKLFYIVLLVLVVSIVAIMYSTKFVIKVFLHSPIQYLEQGIERVTEGDYTYQFKHLIDPQLSRIARRFEHMARKVETREIAQHQLNQNLQVEITERKHAEEKLMDSKAALRESEENFRGIVERNFDGILVIDLEGRFSYISPSVYRISGYSAEEITGKPFLDYIVDSDKPMAIRDFEGLLMGDDAKSSRMKIVKKDGSIIHIDTNSAPIRKEGTLSGVQTIFRDVSDQVYALEEIKRLNRGLEARVEERTVALQTTLKDLEAFSYSVSHDLRAPLRHMEGYVNLLQKRHADNLDHKARRYLDHISSSARRMNRLIVDLLAFSRSGQVPIHKKPVDLNRLVSDIRNEMAAEIQERVIKWEIGELPIVEGDAVLLRQAIQNLFQNAVKFSAGRELTRIRVGSMEKRADDLKCTIFISDNGVGFDQKYVGKLFEVFQRQHPGDEFDGSGIGLAIVRKIIHRHGGDVWAEGQVGKGATFYLSLDGGNRQPSGV
ncbi:MAG: PAS domain S-box protein [Desulfobacteraceae bacterium]|nr:PAS domain S-box protein [Desulfobacteraceae bacterium]